MDTQKNISHDLLKRSNGILSDTIVKKSVLIVGCGSGGSKVADDLIRTGLGRVTLIDHDVVEAHNLSRTIYRIGDIGKPKVEALRDHLLSINPGLEVEIYPCKLAEFGTQKASELIAGVELVLGLTDDPKAQSDLNRLCYHAGTNVIFAGLYRGAKGGEAMMCLPGKTPCRRCVTAGYRELVGEVERSTDYGTSRLEGEVALGADIHHLDTATVKLALSVLLQDCPEAIISDFAQGVLKQGKSYVLMSMSPDYWIFPAVFGNKVPGQYAYQSIWLGVEANPKCPVCGDEVHRENPHDFPMEGPTF